MGNDFSDKDLVEMVIKITNDLMILKTRLDAIEERLTNLRDIELKTERNSVKLSFLIMTIGSAIGMVSGIIGVLVGGLVDW